MDRLTIKPGICANASTDYCESQEDCCLCLHGKEMRFRLSAYEDTNMTPEEIRDMKEMFHAYRHICARVTPERIKELVEADKDGKVWTLPVKLGTQVFELKPQMYINSESMGTMLTVVADAFSWEMVPKFGDTVFLTRETAEKALEVRNEK